MRLLHHGVTIELDDDDPRVAIIETTIFGRPLPPPLPLPRLPEPEPEPEAITAPAPPPAPWMAFWKDLRPMAKRWLLRLAEGEVLARKGPELLALKRLGLVSLHQHIAATGRRTKVAFPILAKGRGRQRRYYLSEDSAALVERLARLEAPNP